jgi:uncharacterized protein (DUF1499 family)
MTVAWNRPRIGSIRRPGLRLLILAAVLLSPYAVTLTMQPVPQLGPGLHGLGGLSPCGNAPNCVETNFTYVLTRNVGRFVAADAPDAPPNHVEPLELPNDSDAAWARLLETLKRERGVTVVKSTERYIRAERRTTVYQLIDDVEFLRLHTGMVLVRAAARLGHSDFGRNRRFVERLRSQMEISDPDAMSF